MATMLLLEPRELVFTDVRLEKVQTQTIRLTNPLRAPVDVDVRSGSSDKYSVHPSSFRIKPEEVLDIAISLRVPAKFAQRQKATEAGHKDHFFIKTPFFDQRFDAVFFLHPDEVSSSSASSARSSSGSTRLSRANSLQSKACSPVRAARVEDAAMAQQPEQSAGSSPLKARASAAIGQLGSNALEAGSGSGSDGQPLASTERLIEGGLLSPEASYEGHQRKVPAAAMRHAVASSQQQMGSVHRRGQDCSSSSQQLLDECLHEYAGTLQDQLHAQLGSSTGSLNDSKNIGASADVTAVRLAASPLTSSKQPLQPSQLAWMASEQDWSKISTTPVWDTAPLGTGAAAAATAGPPSARSHRPVRKSVSFADLPAWTSSPDDAGTAARRTPDADRALDTAWAQPKSALTRHNRRASDSEAVLSTSQQQKQSSSHTNWRSSLANRLNSPAFALVTAADAIVQHSSNSSSSSSAGLASSSGLQSWKESVKAVRQAQETALASAGKLACDVESAGASSATATAAGSLLGGLTSRLLGPFLEDASSKSHDRSTESKTLIGSSRSRNGLRFDDADPARPTTTVASDSKGLQLPLHQGLDHSCQGKTDEATVAVRTDEQQEPSYQSGHSGWTPRLSPVSEEMLSHSERNRRALEVLLQKDNTIRQLRKDLQTAEQLVAKHQHEKEAAQVSAAAARWRIEQLEQQLQQAKQLHADEVAKLRSAHAAEVASLQDAAAAQARRLMQAELAVSRAALSGAAELPDEAGAAAQVLLLQRQLADTAAALSVSQQRLSELEAAQALFAAAAEEGELLVAQQQQCAGAAAREAARQQTEAAVARTTSARLNARVTELSSQVADSQAQVASLSQQLQDEQHLHQRDCKALQQRVAALVAAGGPHLAALRDQLDDIAGHGTAIGDAQPLLDQQVPGSTRRPATSAAATAGSSDEMELYCDTPAGQISFLQAALADAEGAVSLLQVAGLSVELSQLKRSEQCLKADVHRLQQQLATAEQQLSEARDELQLQRLQEQEVAISTTYPLMRAARLLEAVTTYGGKALEKSQQGNSRGQTARSWPRNTVGMALCGTDYRSMAPSKAEQLDPALQLKAVTEMTGMEQQEAAAAAAAWAAELARGQQLMAELIQRAEKAEMALASASLTRQEQQQDSQWNLGRGLDGRAAQMAQAPNLSLAAEAGDADSYHVTAMRRILPAAASGASSTSALALPTAQNADDQELQHLMLQLQQQLLAVQAELRSNGSRFAQQLAQVQQQAAEAVAAAAAAISQRDEAVAAKAAAKQSAARAKAQAASATSELAAVKAAAASQAQETRQQLAAKDREIQRLSGELDNQAVRAGVLLDTVETLQAGGSSEKEQRLVALTAQLAAAKGLAAAQEARMQDLLVSRAGMELSLLQQRLTSADAEVEGLKTAASQAAARHAEDLTRERQEALGSAQESLAQLLLCEPPHAYTAHKAHIVAVLDGLLAAAQAASSKQAAVSAITSTLATVESDGVKRRKDGAGGSRRQGASIMARKPLLLVGGSSAGDVSWVLGVLAKLKELLLESDSLYIKAHLEAQLAAQQCGSMAAALAATQAAAERLGVQAMAAEAVRLVAERAAGRRAEQAAIQQVDRDSLLAAAAERVKRRDEGLFKWFESRAAVLIGRGGSEHAAPNAATVHLGQAADNGQDTAASQQHCQLMALTREVCGLKLVESQLLASCAAANARCDAATLQAHRLAAALEAATAAMLTRTAAVHIAPSHYRQEGDVSVTSMNAPDNDTVQAAAQASAKEHELYRLKDQLLHANQELRRMVEQQASSAAAALAAERDAAAAQARNAAGAAVEAAQSTAAAVVADMHHTAAGLEQKLLETEQQRDQLQEEVDLLQAMVSDLKAAGEISGAVMAGLEDTLAAIERAERRRSRASKCDDNLDDAVPAGISNNDAIRQATHLAAAGRHASAAVPAGGGNGSGSSSKASSKRASTQVNSGDKIASAATAASKQEELLSATRNAGASQDVSTTLQRVDEDLHGTRVDEDLHGGDDDIAAGTYAADSHDSMAVLSRQLVKAQMALADAQQQLRLSERAGHEIRQRLAERDDYILQLRQELADRSTGSTGSLQLRAAQPPGSSSQAFKSATAGSNGDASQKQQQDGASYRQEGRGRAGSGADAGGATAGERVYLAQQVAALRISLAKRDAEVAQLTGELSEMAQVAAARLSVSGRQALTSIVAAAGMPGRMGSAPHANASMQPGPRCSSWNGATSAARSSSTARVGVDLARVKGGKLLSHSASEAARLARQASDKAAAVLSAAGSAGSGIAQAADELSEVHQLQQQLVEANAQLESVLATVRQVLKELVLGAGPPDELVAQLERELAGLSAEEAVSEVVYQVQDKLTAAAAAVAAAEQGAADGTEAQRGLQVQAAAGDVALGQPRPSMRASAAGGAAGATDLVSAVRYELTGQIQDLSQKLEAAEQDRDAALLRAQAVAAARNDLAKQLATAGAERSSLAQQNAALAAALSNGFIAMEGSDQSARLSTTTTSAAAPPAGPDAQQASSSMSITSGSGGLRTPGVSDPGSLCGTASATAVAQAQEAQCNSLSSGGGTAAAFTAAAAAAAATETSKCIDGESAAGTAARPSPAQLKEIGLLMQRLTQENAALIKARDGALLERAEASSKLAAQQEEAAASERQLVVAARQVSELSDRCQQLELHAAALMGEMKRLAAAGDAAHEEVAEAHAERDGIASQNVALAQTVDQLMAAAADRTHTAAAAAHSETDHADNVGVGRAVTANSLNRLTRENAALIKQRDGFKSELAPAKLQAAQAAAAAEAAARDREVLLEARRQAGAEALAAAAAAASAAASLKQLSAERDRLLLQVAALTAERDSMAAQNINLAATASTLMAGASVSLIAAPEATPAARAATTSSLEPHQAVEAGSRQSHAPGSLPRVLSAAQAKEVGALLTRLTNENAQFLKDKDEAVSIRHQDQDKLAVALLEVQQLRYKLELLSDADAQQCRQQPQDPASPAHSTSSSSATGRSTTVVEAAAAASAAAGRLILEAQQQREALQARKTPGLAAAAAGSIGEAAAAADALQAQHLLQKLEAAEAGMVSRLAAATAAAGSLLARGEELAGSAAAAVGELEGRLEPLLVAAAGVEARVMGLERTLDVMQQAEHAAVVDRMQSEHAAAACASEEVAAAAVAHRLADAEAGRAAAEEAVQQLVEELKAYQAAKSEELASLQDKLEIMLMAAPASVAAEFAEEVAAEAEAAAAAGGGGGSNKSKCTGAFWRSSKPGTLRAATAGTTAGGRMLNKGAGRTAGGSAASCSTRRYQQLHFLGKSSSMSSSVAAPGRRQSGLERGSHRRSQPATQQHGEQPSQPTGTSGALGVPALAAAVVASLQQADRIAAAERELQFEKAARHRAEAAAEALRAAAARLKARLKAVKSETEVLRQAAAAGALAAAEGARAKEEADRAAAELTAAREALKAARHESNRRQRAVSAAAAAAAAAAALNGSRAAGAGGGDAAASLMAAVAAAAAGGGQAGLHGFDVEGLLQLLQRELAGQQSAREVVEVKLRECKATIDRKNLMIRELKGRVEDLSARLAASPSADLDARATAAEGRVKQLTANINRKDGLLKDTKQELDRQVKMIGRLRAEVTRKEAALKPGLLSLYTSAKCMAN
eukprot:gene1932-2262_t